MKKPLFFCTVFLIVTLVFLAFTGGIRDSNPLYPVYHFSKGTEKVILTFNVLWEADEELDTVLSFLQSQDIEAVFFVTGEWVRKFPDSANKILEYGQILGNRSVSNQRLILLTEEEIMAEINGFNEISLETLNYSPVFFRPPYGEYNSKIVRVAHETDCLTLLWSINIRTMTEQEPEFIINHLEERLHPGAIILVHLSSHVHIILPQIVEFLNWKGYTIESPHELLN